MKAASILRGFGYALLFAAAFGGTCWLAARWLPFPDVPNVAKKRAHLAAHGDEYDALFVGSSRVEMQIIPAAFDQRMAELGSPIRSFNAGISAMTPPEDAFLFDEIARGPHRRLRWVFIELDSLRLKADRARREGGRLTYWHDAGRMQLLGQAFLVEWRRTQAKLAKKSHRNRPWSERLEIRLIPVEDLLEHLSAFFQNQTNLGRGAALAANLFEASSASATDSSIAHAGWGRFVGTMPEKDREEYERTYAARLTTPQSPLQPNPAGTEALRRLVQRVRAIGAAPVLLVSPTTRRTQFMPPEDLARSCLILNFSDVRAFPDLFRLEHRLDVEHLNEHGAPFYSRLLAERFFAATRPPLPH